MLTLFFKHGLSLNQGLFSEQRSGREKAREANLDVEANPSGNLSQVPARELAIQHLEIEHSHVSGFHRGLQIIIQRELHIGSSLHRRKEISSGWARERYSHPSLPPGS